jgi:hypothetical protein
MKCVPTHFPNVQIRADDTFDASLYNLCTDKLLKELEKRLKGFERIKFTVFHY